MAVDEGVGALRVTAEVMGSDGSSSMATVSAASLAMLHAGAPLSSMTAGISVGLVRAPAEGTGPADGGAWSDAAASELDVVIEAVHAAKEGAGGGGGGGGAAAAAAAAAAAHGEEETGMVAALRPVLRQIEFYLSAENLAGREN